MSLTRKQLALVHVARAQLGMAEDDYRAILKQEAGVGSSRELDETGFAAVMARMQALGFENPNATAPFKQRPARASFGTRPGMASMRQVEMIRDLYAEYKGGQPGDAELGRWIQRTFKVSSIRFLDYGDAQRAIGALKTMKSRKRDAEALHAS
jgi:hypothetical protein